MHKSSLLEILRTFSKQELIEFEDFINSPYFNKKENLVKLFLEIRKCAPEFTDENLGKEKVWMNLFPGKEYNYGIMKNLIHELTKLCESFITIEFSNQDKLRNNTDLLQALLERQITRVLSSKIEMFEKIYDSHDFKNENYNIERYYDFLATLYELKSIYNWKYNIGNTEFYKFTVWSIDYQIYSAIIAFYKDYNNYTADSHKRIQNKDNTAEIFLTGLNKNLILQLLKNVKVKSERDYLILKCFCDMNFALNADANIESYSIFKKSLQDCSHLISKQDLRNLMICLTNSLVKMKVNKSVSGINYNKEIFENYNFMIENDIYLPPNGIVLGNTYINYIMAAFYLKEYERIEIFKKMFDNKIPEDRRENDNNFSQALIFFGKMEYSKSLEHLSQSNHDFFNMKHYIKNIQMMNYYELDDYISFNYIMDSYRHFLSKNKSVTSYSKSVSENLCNSINKLFKLRELFDKFELEKFRKEIEENDELINKYWILDKITEIEKKRVSS